MAKIIKHIANANNRLGDFLTQIDDALKMADRYVLPKLNAKHDIDIVISDAFRDTIPESHIGGHTYASDFITITIDSDSAEIRTSDLFITICHELCHAIRWQYNDEWSKTMFDAMIFEGLATTFGIEATSDNNLELDYYTKTVIKQSNQSLSILKDNLLDTDYNYDKVFFNGDEKLGLPHWAGYSLGYYFVQKYLNENSKKASDIFADTYDNFKFLLGNL